MPKSNDEQQQGDKEKEKKPSSRRRRHHKRSSRPSLFRKSSSASSIKRSGSRHSLNKGKDRGSRRKSNRFIIAKGKVGPTRSSKRLVKRERQQASHLSKTVQTWKLRWKNKFWRQKWKYLWGKNKWKPNIRKRWAMDKKWRRKWMKKILKKWWDKKWRRKWLKSWIDSRWLLRWNRKRALRKMLWKKRWRKCGAKRMGLTFNEFLLTERRLKTLQKVPASLINKRRKERHLQKEKIIREKQEKRIKVWEDKRKMCFCDRISYTLFRQEFYGPETFEIRPSVIQFKFYMLNAIQGLVAFLLVLYYHLTNDFNLPPQFLLQGLYILVYFASAMDFYGSIFGMVTSFHLESYYNSRNEPPRRKKKRTGCCCCCLTGKEDKENPDADKNLSAGQGDESLQTAPSTSNTAIKKSDSKTRHRTGSASSHESTKEEKKLSFKRRSSKGRDKRSSFLSTTTRRHRSKNKHQHDNVDMGHLRSKMADKKEQQDDGTVLKTTLSAKSLVDKEKVKCQCSGLGFLYCCMIRKCFRPGRSREFINRMGYCSWILLQLAWFLNVFFTAYYNWVDVYYKDYKLTYAKCEIFPRPKLCEDFDWLFCFLMIVVGVTFVLRNIFLFIVGMCFSERHLRRCQSTDPTEELASTCSDTDIDYSKVPRPILVPHVMSGGKYPYVLPGPCRPVDYLLEKIQKVTEKHRKAKLRAEGGQKKSKRAASKRKDKRRRLLTAHEREAAKVLAGFKQVRRARTVMEKGKRKPWRIPVAAGVTDEFQLPPDLMTTKAWAWLYDDESTEEEKRADGQTMLRQRRVVKWRRGRNRKVEPIDSAVLTTLHHAASASKLPIREIVKPKLKNLSDRDSTDDSWSGDASSLFETASGYSPDDELDNGVSEAYLELMNHGEMLQSDGRKSEFIIFPAGGGPRMSYAHQTKSEYNLFK